MVGLFYILKRSHRVLCEKQTTRDKDTSSKVILEVTFAVILQEIIVVLTRMRELKVRSFTFRIYFKRGNMIGLADGLDLRPEEKGQ